MKRHAIKTVIIVLLMFVFSMAAITAVKLSQRETQFKATRIALKTVLQIQASAINDGYFSWSEVRNLVEKRNFARADELLQDIYALYPFIVDVSLKRGTPPAGAYEIEGFNSTIRLRFSLKDDFGANPLPGWVAVVEMDGQALLDALRSENKLVIDPLQGHELAYSLKVDFADPLLNWTDYLFVILATAAAGYLISVWLWRRSVYFYETKGLDSIIFLFEQTERASANHSRRVAALAIFLAERMGYKGRKLRNLYTAALLHDIGKISISSNILQKDGPLSEAEQRAMMTHPIISARILRNFKELAHLSSIVLYHHERMDGSGYPEGLKGNEIPEESRIIAVVDVFEALIGDRPYRDPINPTDAFDALKAMPLDQKIVQILAGHYKDFSHFRAPKWAVAYNPMAILEGA